jgi:hypothetical protein
LRERKKLAESRKNGPDRPFLSGLTRGNCPAFAPINKIEPSQGQNNKGSSLSQLCLGLSLYILRIFPKMVRKSSFTLRAKPERVWQDDRKDGLKILIRGHAAGGHGQGMLPSLTCYADRVSASLQGVPHDGNESHFSLLAAFDDADMVGVRRG